MYCSREDIEAIFGETNVAKWADLDNTGDVSSIDARITRAIATATAEVNSILAGSPIRTPIQRVPQLIKDVTASLAGVLLYEARGPQVFNDPNAGATHPYMFKRMWALQVLNELRDGKRKIVELL